MIYEWIIYRKYSGKCDIDCVCQLNTEPVCCSGVEYDNECQARCAGHETYDCVNGKCNDCKCEKLWHPLCCNGTDYINPCQARCGGTDHPLFQCDAGTC